MKKNFITICFMLVWTSLAWAKTTEITNPAMAPKPQTQAQIKNATTKNHQMSRDELEDFLAERIRKTIVEKIDEVSTGNMSTVLSETTLQKIKEESKPEFQKIYEKALAKVTNQETLRLPTAFWAQESAEQQQAEWRKPNFPVIEAVLPDSPEKVLIPAKEHIPYLYAQIDILPDGDVKIQDTITVVSSGDKVRNHIYKKLPASLLLRNGDKQKLSYTLVDATVNGQKLDYQIVRDVDGMVLVSNKTEALKAGVYTYRFEYLVHNLMGIYPDFDEFYWDVTGSWWNLVIGKLAATITFPKAEEPLGQVVLVGSARNLSPNDANVMKMRNSTYGYVSMRPLFVGEGFHVISSLPHGIIAAPTLGDRLFAGIEKHGDIVFSAMALAMIFLGFLFSKKYIRRNVGQVKCSLKRSAPLIRFLNEGRYDMRAFIGFLLELYKKNIIDIQQSDDTILLVKRTDQMQSLSKSEQKAVFALFGSQESVLNVNKNNILKLRRAANFIEKELRMDLTIFRLKLNSGYILFSLGMVFAGEIFTAILAENLALLRILVPATVILAVSCLLFNLQVNRNILNIALKAISTALILLTLATMAAVISLVAALLIFAGILTIFYFTANYARRDGLLKPYIEEIKQLKEQLATQKESLRIGREIANWQANIWGLNLEKEFGPDTANEYNKLAAASGILQKLA